jgi:hypothetical protein
MYFIRFKKCIFFDLKNEIFLFSDFFCKFLKIKYDSN